MSKDDLADVIATAAKEFNYQEKHDAPGSPSTAGFLHGPGGLLSYPGLDPMVFHTIMGQRQGLMAQLPTRATRFGSPVFEVLTGIGAGSGSEKEDVCDNAPIGGVLAGCKFTAPFGRYERATREVEINRLGLLNDRAEPMDLRLIGSANFESAYINASGPPADVLTNEFNRLFWERAVEYERLLNRQTWNGNPANNAAGGGYKEFAGIDLMLGSSAGWIDAETGSACPSTAPDLKNFQCARVDQNGDELVNTLSYMYRYVRSQADATGVSPVRWAFVMREDLFWEVTKVWPCSYLSYACQNPDLSGNFTVNIDSGDTIQMRDDMRANKFLLIDGVRIDVILDDAIAFDTDTTSSQVDAGCFCSDIYLLPFSVSGGISVLYLEHLDYRAAGVANAVNDQLGLYRVTNGGAFVETVRQTNWCVQWQAKIEPRIVLRTPWLAGRLQNVGWCPLQTPPQSFPDDPYFVDGGETSRPGPSLFNPWS
jgi:hypothetical protein